jgi:hypothetical protein
MRKRSANGRTAIWAAIRRWNEYHPGEPFSVAVIHGLLRGPSKKYTIRGYCEVLAKAGVLRRFQRFTEKGVNSVLFQLVNDSGIETPRVRNDGTHVSAGAGQQAMWDVLRTSRSPVTPEGLIAYAPDHAIALSTAKSYLGRLTRAGYLRRKDGWYQLVRNTGPLAPQITHTKTVRDPNTAMSNARPFVDESQAEHARTKREEGRIARLERKIAVVKGEETPLIDIAEGYDRGEEIDHA